MSKLADCFSIPCKLSSLLYLTRLVTPCEDFKLFQVRLNFWRVFELPKHSLVCDGKHKFSKIYQVGCNKVKSVLLLKTCLTKCEKNVASKLGCKFQTKFYYKLYLRDGSFQT